MFVSSERKHKNSWLTSFSVHIQWYNSIVYPHKSGPLSVKPYSYTFLQSPSSLSSKLYLYTAAFFARGTSPPTFNLYPSLPFSVPKFFRSTFFAPISGKSNGSLFPPLRPSHAPIFCQFVHVSAPTHGCTFHPSSNTTSVRFCNLPLISVIWYFGRWLRRCSSPRG
jgi:hypothetical protein